MLLALGLALVVDPRGDFGTGMFPCVALDSRRDKMRLFEDYNRRGAVHGIVLGSSRSMLLSCSKLGANSKLRWFNFSVDSARTEDYLAIYRWVRNRDSRLGRLIIGLDVEALHDHCEMDSRLKANSGLMRSLGGGRQGATAQQLTFSDC